MYQDISKFEILLVDVLCERFLVQNEELLNNADDLKWCSYYFVKCWSYNEEIDAEVYRRDRFLSEFRDFIENQDLEALIEFYSDAGVIIITPVSTTLPWYGILEIWYVPPYAIAVKKPIRYVIWTRIIMPLLRMFGLIGLIDSAYNISVIGPPYS